jgi:hypothetical protein
MNEIVVGSEAVAAGRLTRHELSRRYRRVYHGIYVLKNANLTLRERAIAAWLASGRRAIISGAAAAGLHGAPWVDPQTPIEILGVKCRAQPGLIPRTERVSSDEVTTIAGLAVTTRARTGFDLGRWRNRGDALARLDTLMWHQGFTVDQVEDIIERYPRARGVRQLRDLLPLVDGGAASPRESITRLRLIDAGLPAPQTQIPIFDGGRAVAYLDMGWKKFKVAVEYDGDQHRTDRRQYVKDIQRLRMLEAMGWIIIRVIAEDHPQQWLAQVLAALTSRGCAAEINEIQRLTRTFAA